MYIYSSELNINKTTTTNTTQKTKKMNNTDLTIKNLRMNPSVHEG
jgi:hypothetical protein